jgi:predicted TIM-barrel fold metal-dependent hydrolase
MLTEEVLDIVCVTDESDGGFISVDDHVQEHPRVWTDRLSSKKWGDRIPRLEKDSEGFESWIIDGVKYPLCDSVTPGTLMPGRAGKRKSWSDIPKCVYDPKERLKAMEIDGLSYSVLYPSVAGIAGERFERVKDLELRQACVRAYNDWLVEEWGAISSSFIPQCIVPVYPVSATVAEIKRAVSIGHRGVVFPALPSLLRELPGPADAGYDAVWRTCEELDIPLCLHSGCATEIQFPAYAGFSGLLANAFQAITRPLSSSFILATALFSDILLRHPKLKVIFADCPVGWGMFSLETLDYMSRLEGATLKPAPSEIFKRQCYFVLCHESVDWRIGKQINPKNLLWASHFPLPTSTWPDSRNCVRSNLEKLPQLDRRGILWANADDLYKLHPQKETNGATKAPDQPSAIRELNLDVRQ